MNSKSYWFNNVFADQDTIKQTFGQRTGAYKLAFSAILCVVATLLQSAGAVIPGVGLMISPFATAPIAICAMLSLPYGGIAYLSSTCLLIFLQPSEALIFPFTTGLLGVGIGIAFSFSKCRIVMVPFSGLMLALGVCFLLYVVGFPVLGPMVTSSIKLQALGLIYVFSCLYAWIWTELIQLFLIKLVRKRRF